MTLYMVYRDLYRRTPEQLAAIQKAATDVSQQFSAAGSPVRYICTTLLPGQVSSICWFEASSITLVKEANEAADLPFTQITEPPSVLTHGVEVGSSQIKNPAEFRGGFWNGRETATN